MRNQKYIKMIENKEFITKKRNKKFHKFVAERFKSWTMWFPGCDVHHWDENPCNNHPLNLGCMTHKEHMKLHGDAKKGILRSSEIKIKISKTKTGKTKKPHSKETKLKMSLAHKGKIVSEETRSKFYKPYTHNGITYKSRKDAALAIGITAKALGNIIHYAKKALQESSMSSLLDVT